MCAAPVSWYRLVPKGATDARICTKDRLQSLDHLTGISRGVGFSLKGLILNLDGVFDSKKNRKTIFNRGMVPNSPEHKRNRRRPKPDPKRMFDAAIHGLRLVVERTFAWEDKF